MRNPIFWPKTAMQRSICLAGVFMLSAPLIIGSWHKRSVANKDSAERAQILTSFAQRAASQKEPERFLTTPCNQPDLLIPSGVQSMDHLLDNFHQPALKKNYPVIPPAMIMDYTQREFEELLHGNKPKNEQPKPSPPPALPQTITMTGLFHTPLG